VWKVTIVAKAQLYFWIPVNERVGKMRTYKLHFRTRENGILIDKIREIKAQNKHAATSYGKSQETDNYWFIGIVNNVH